ncbi:hypothetical protein ACSS6W_002242 [Trichoderma asperelloides]|uniref:2EXR domain-containing protein n=1 Tax=Trichoderma asperellum TaxID=101201 RepID=A0A6V8QRL0_TRIAP|nr:hypothetical protein LI328DRAFT_40673 [Trichoderma asperelloides]GFP54446.1 hypothetical protein TASIC1_0004007000 [Trichoderma asperellum]
MPQPSELLLRYAECTDDDSYDSAVEDEFYNGEDPWDENPYKGRVFHKFAELPPELRIKIWKLGLAGLTQPQLLEFTLRSSVRKDPNEMVADEIGMLYPRRYRDWTITGSPSLVRATELNRNVMAVNREARDVAIKLLPHSLKIRTPAGHGIVHFDRNRDIIQLRGYNYEVMHPFPVEERFPDFVYHFDGFAENVVQLAVRHNDFFDEDEDTSDYFTLALRQFQNLKRLFLLSTHDKFIPSDLLWCGSDYIYVHTSMITDGRNEPLWTKWCWPNADEYDDFTRNQVCGPITQLLPAAALPLLRTRGVELFPMVVFEDKYGLEFLKKLKGKWERTYNEGNLASESESSSDEEEEESEPNEYESEGIDDSEIEEDDEDGSNSGIDSFFDDDSDIDDLSGAGVGEIVPVFSDPEPEPEPEVAGGARHSRKRRIVTDSDDEDDDISERSGRKHARTDSFPAPDEGSEDEAISRPSGAGRSRRRAAVVDSDDDEEDGGGALGSKPDNHESSKKDGAKKRGKSDKRTETDDDDDDNDDDEDGEEEEEEEEEEEIMDVRRLSLASRLQRIRESHPSSGEESNGEEEDSDNITDDEDDDDEDDDEDEEMYGGGLIDGYADESDDSGNY